MVIDECVQIYFEEAAELLEELEACLLELEKDPSDMETVRRAFRALHTIKGSGAMFGFSQVVKFTHEVESLFDLIRNGEFQVSGEVIDLTLQARDNIKSMLKSVQEGKPVDETDSEKIIQRVKELISGGNKSEVKQSAPVSPPPPPDTDVSPVTYRIRFAPHCDAFCKGIDPLCILPALKEMGPCKIIARMENIPLLDEMEPEACYIFWDIILKTKREISAFMDIFLFADESSKIQIDAIDDDDDLDEREEYKKLGEILVERGDLDKKSLEDVLKKQKRLGQILVEEGLVKPQQIEVALEEQNFIRQNRQKKRAKSSSCDTVRVSAGKLDSLVNLAGELALIQERLGKICQDVNLPGLSDITQEMKRLAATIRNNTLEMRITSVSGTFEKFRRLARDLSRQLNKDVEFVTRGAHTEIDRALLERLDEPLLHLIRNSIDHGIEPPWVRESRGKPPRGKICLSALHMGDQIRISISDDGGGLDSEAIKVKAIRRGLISADSKSSEAEIYQLIFSPGFSTKEEVTGVSGRGVGMDVVKKSIDDLGGSIDIYSREKMGAEISLNLPLTVSFVEGLLTGVGEQFFVIPSPLLDEIVETGSGEGKIDGCWYALPLREEIIPAIHLGEYFSIREDPSTAKRMAVVNINGSRIGLIIDSVVGEYETIIKPLGKFYKDVKDFCGATILADGSVALILNLPQIFAKAKKKFPNTIFFSAK